MSDLLKFGLIGLGKMGRIRFEELRRRPDLLVSIGADPDSATHSYFDGLKCSAQADDVIDSDVDAVVVATPNAVTAGYVIRALDSGKHVLCEKPPGATLEDVHRIIEAEQRNPGCVLKFGFNHRYHAGIREARRIIESGRLGEILWVRGIYGKAGGPGFTEQWRSRREHSGGGILLDQGIHMLDLFRVICGEFVEVKSMVSTSYWEVDVEDNAFALLRDAHGRVAMLHSSSTHWQHRFNLDVYMSKGYLSVNGILSATRTYGDEAIAIAHNNWEDGDVVGRPQEDTIYFDTDPSWELEIGDFVRHIRDGSPVESGNSQDALRAMELVFAIYENDGALLSRAERKG